MGGSDTQYRKHSLNEYEGVLHGRLDSNQYVFLMDDSHGIEK